MSQAEPTPSSRTVGGGSGLAALAQLVTAVAGGLMSIVVARLLGPTGTGQFGVMQSSLLILGLVSALGIEVGTSYHVGGRRWPAADAIRQTAIAAVVLGVAGGAAGLAIAAVTSGTAFRGISLGVVLVALAGLPFTLVWTFASFLAISTQSYLASARIVAGQAVLMLALVGLLTPIWDFKGAVLGLALSNAATGLGALAWGLRHYGPATAAWIHDARTRVVEAARFGVRSTAAASLAVINQRADLFVLNAVAASAVVGHYAVAVSVTSLGLLAPRALSQVVMPRVAALADPSDADSLRLMTRKSVRHGVVVTLGTAALLVVGLALVPLVYGSDFGPAVVLGLILVPGVASLGLSNVLAASVVGRGRPELALRVALIVTPPTLALYAVAIPALEATGAALTSTASYAATAALMWPAFRTATGERSLSVLVPRADDLADYRALAGRAAGRFRRRHA